MSHRGFAGRGRRCRDRSVRHLLECLEPRLSPAVLTVSAGVTDGAGGEPASRDQSSRFQRRREQHDRAWSRHLYTD